MVKIKSSVRVGLYLVKIYRSWNHLFLVGDVSESKPVVTCKRCTLSIYEIHAFQEVEDHYERFDLLFGRCVY
jgi:hypothetical protein